MMDINKLIELKESLSKEDIDKIATAVVKKLKQSSVDIDDDEEEEGKQKLFDEGTALIRSLFSEEVSYIKSDFNILYVDSIINKSDSSIKFKMDESVYQMFFNEDKTVSIKAVVDGKSHLLNVEIRTKEENDPRITLNV